MPYLNNTTNGSRRGTIGASNNAAGNKYHHVGPTKQHSKTRTPKGFNNKPDSVFNNTLFI